jgi:DNA mismatch endonuclease (patch repair protein)
MRLRQIGWTVARVWEHEDAVEAADRVQALLTQLRGGADIPSIKT